MIISSPIQNTFKVQSNVGIANHTPGLTDLIISVKQHFNKSKIMKTKMNQKVTPRVSLKNFPLPWPSSLAMLGFCILSTQLVSRTWTWASSVRATETSLSLLWRVTGRTVSDVWSYSLKTEGSTGISKTGMERLRWCTAWRITSRKWPRLFLIDP